MFFSGKNPMVTNSFKLSSVTMEGTQLQTIGAFDGMMKKGKLKRKQFVGSIYLMKLQVHDHDTDESWQLKEGLMTYKGKPES